MQPFYSLTAFNVYILTSVLYVAQLEDVPQWVEHALNKCLRRLILGSEDWISAKDLETLKRVFLIPGRS